MEIVRYVWRYKHVNNTSNVKKQLQTFVRLKFYWQLWLECMLFITDQKAYNTLQIKCMLRLLP